MILLRGKVGHRRLHGPYQSQLVGPSFIFGLYFAVWSLALSLPLLGLSATYLHTAMRFVAFTACLYVPVVIQWGRPLNTLVLV